MNSRGFLRSGEEQQLMCLLPRSTPLSGRVKTRPGQTKHTTTCFRTRVVIVLYPCTVIPIEKISQSAQPPTVQRIIRTSILFSFGIFNQFKNDSSFNFNFLGTRTHTCSYYYHTLVPGTNEAHTSHSIKDKKHCECFENRLDGQLYRGHREPSP